MNKPKTLRVNLHAANLGVTPADDFVLKQCSQRNLGRLSSGGFVSARVVLLAPPLPPEPPLLLRPPLPFEE